MEVSHEARSTAGAQQGRLINSLKSPGNLKIRARLEAGLSQEQILIHISRVKVEKPPRLREESTVCSRSCASSQGAGHPPLAESL